MLCYFKKGKNETHTKKICAACGESAVTDRKSKKWFAKFHATDASPEDTPWWGRAAEGDSGQTKALTDSSHMGDSWQAQNTQVNKVSGENENVFLFYKKTHKWTFWLT